MRFADRLRRLEQQAAPPPPPPLVIYCEPSADFAAEVEQHPDAVAVLPATLDPESWEGYAIRQQAESAAHAAERVREIMGDGTTA